MNNEEEKKFFEKLIADRWIPITYRNIFKQYLKWKEEQGE